MPIIASAQFNIKVHKNNVVEILKTELKQCDCLDIKEIIITTGINSKDIMESLKILTGANIITCNEDYSLCCTDLEKLKNFSASLNKIRQEVRI